MSPIARDGKLPLQSKKAPERQASTLNSTDAMAMVEHGSEVSLNVTTPPLVQSLLQPAHLLAVTQIILH